MSLMNARSILKCTRLLTDSVSSNIRVLEQVSPMTWQILNKRTFLSSTTESAKPEETAPPPNISETEKNLKVEIENLTKSLELMSEKREDFEDKYKRALADNENLRKRMVKQVDDAKLFGIQGFCKDLLEVADVLNLGIESVPKNEINNNNPHLKNLFEGLTMTKAQLDKVFQRHGLVQLNPLNEKFDPNMHEAIFQQEVEGKEPGTVFVVSKIGYKLHERVIRPAMVGVTKSP